MIHNHRTRLVPISGILLLVFAGCDVDVSYESTADVRSDSTIEDLIEEKESELAEIESQLDSSKLKVVEIVPDLTEIEGNQKPQRPNIVYRDKNFQEITFGTGATAQELPSLSDTPAVGKKFVHNKRITDSFQAKVVSVHDGDTITVLTENKTQLKIRIDSVDTPESGQPFGKRAKQALSESLFGSCTYPTCEHWMMAEKARLFGDYEQLDLIHATDSPKEAKARGRKVQGFNAETWDPNKIRIVTEGNSAKFEQHDDLNEFLQSTGGTVLVEAAGRDVIWGIGLGASNPKAQDPNTWRGKNLLGFVLTTVREQLR